MKIRQGILSPYRLANIRIYLEMKRFFYVTLRKIKIYKVIVADL
ncbi:hypothetical protein [uncultured Bacteroides sp.]|nr:hypothetical protein [uncultured Bacteroides sp.]